MQKKVYQRWKRLLAGFWTSNSTLAEYCRQHNLNYKNASRWKRNLQNAGNDTIDSPAELEFVQLDLGRRFYPPQSSGIRLELGELRIEVEKDFDPQTLKQILSLLEVR